MRVIYILCIFILICAQWWNLVCYLNVDPFPTSTSCPPDAGHSHGVSALRLPCFSPLFCFRVLYWTHTEEQKRGRPGNEATCWGSTSTDSDVGIVPSSVNKVSATKQAVNHSLEIFHVKNNSLEKFCDVKFVWFVWSAKFLRLIVTIWTSALSIPSILVYYQVLVAF